MTIKEFKRKIKYKGFNELLEAYVFICDKYHYSDRRTALDLIVVRLKLKGLGIVTGKQIGRAHV